MEYMVTADSPQDFETGNYGKGKLAILNTDTGEIEAKATVGFFPHTVATLDSISAIDSAVDSVVATFDIRVRGNR